MIREFKIDDKDKLIEIIKKDNIIKESEIISKIESEDKKILVYDENGIKGVVFFSISDKKTKKCEINFYVKPESRRKGIGTALYNEIGHHIEKIKPNILVTEFRVDRDNPTSFYKKLGYKKWFGCHEMYYRGETQTAIDLQFVSYEDKYYDKFVKVGQDCFYELRKENDMQPYLCPNNESYREYRLNKKDYTFVALDNEEIIATAFVEDGYIDDIMVSPAYQGKGYGKKATQFAINKALSNGEDVINLSVVEWNTKAEAMYKSLGFEIVQTIHVYRQFCGK